MRAVIDRIEGTYAVLFVGEEETQINIPSKLLPEGAKEGSCLSLHFELDDQAEQQQREKIEHMLNRLKRKGR